MEKLSEDELGELTLLAETRRADEILPHLPIEQGQFAFLFFMSLDSTPIEVLEAFLDCGLHVDARDGSSSIVELAAHEPRRDVVELLLRRGAKLDGIPLVSAVQGGDIEIVRMLIEAGAHVNRGNPGSPTPLKMARTCKRPDIERLLVENGATELVGKGRDTD